jgi:hypothetical protein
VRIYSAPTVASWGPGRLDVFATNNVGGVYHLWYPDYFDDGVTLGWSRWQEIGGTSFQEYPPDRTNGTVFSAPAAVSFATNRIDLFVRGTNSKLFWKPYPGIWEAWQDLGDYDICSAPAASTRGIGPDLLRPGILDVFATDASGGVYHKYRKSGTWSLWEILSGISFNKSVYPYPSVDEAPGAVSWDGSRVDVFLRGKTTNPILYQKVWTG